MRFAARARDSRPSAEANVCRLLLLTLIYASGLFLAAWAGPLTRPICQFGVGGQPRLPPRFQFQFQALPNNRRMSCLVPFVG